VTLREGPRQWAPIICYFRVNPNRLVRLGDLIAILEDPGGADPVPLWMSAVPADKLVFNKVGVVVIQHKCTV
jgi:hypothetical protein